MSKYLIETYDFVFTYSFVQNQKLATVKHVYSVNSQSIAFMFTLYNKQKTALRSIYNLPYLWQNNF